MSDQYQQQPGRPQYGQSMPYGPGYPVAPEHPQGTLVLVLGIVGIFFTLAAPFAWYLGSKATRQMQASGTAYSNESMIRIGRILGMVFTILAIVGIVFTIVFLVVIGIVAAGQQ